MKPEICTVVDNGGVKNATSRQARTGSFSEIKKFILDEFVHMNGKKRLYKMRKVP
jgi:hypothetical protein